jgi:ectoine hydroxylase-related dioxygenase (phytanoyl-CoA dioxygenase family)
MRHELDIVRFELEPGDCTLHHGLTVHGAPGNSRPDRRRRAHVSRWAGDDAVYAPRPGIQEMPAMPDIPAGGPIDSDLWPRVWPAPTSKPRRRA